MERSPLRCLLEQNKGNPPRFRVGPAVPTAAGISSTFPGGSRPRGKTPDFSPKIGGGESDGGRREREERWKPTTLRRPRKTGRKRGISSKRSFGGGTHKG